eukprot:821379-Rhodomonas_salina.1
MIKTRHTTADGDEKRQQPASFSKQVASSHTLQSSLSFESSPSVRPFPQLPSSVYTCVERRASVPQKMIPDNAQ